MLASDFKASNKKMIIEFFNRKTLKDICFVGIDRSLSSTGIAVVQDGKIKFQTEIKIKEYGEKRLYEIGKACVQNVMAYPNPLVCMESYSYSSMGPVFELGELGGVLKVFFLMKGIQFLEVEPTTLKKYITGKGNTNKALVPMYINKKFNITPSGGDEADAIGCSFLCYHAFKYLKESKDGNEYTIPEKEAMDTFLDCNPKVKKRKGGVKQLALSINA